MTTVEARAQAAANAALDEATHARIAEMYTQALDQLRAAEEWRAKGDEFASLRQNADVRMQEIQAELAQPVEAPALPEDDDLTITQLELRLAERVSAHSGAQAALSDLERESALRAERRRQVPDLQAGARQRLDELPPVSPAEGEPVEIAEAASVLRQARRQAIEMELRAYEEELLSYDARGRLLSLRIDRARRNVEQAAAAVDAWRGFLAERRQRDAAAAWQTVRDTEILAALRENAAPEAIQTLATDLSKRIRELLEARTAADGLLRKTEQADARIRAVTETINTLESDFSSLRKKVEAASNSSVIGVLLRGHRRNLPDIRAIEQDIRNRQQELAELQIAQISAEEARRELYNIDALVSGALEFAPGNTEPEIEAIRVVLSELYTVLRDSLDGRVEDFETCFDRLLSLNSREEQLVATVREFRDYISERVLWVRSGEALSLNEWSGILRGLRWLADGENLRALAHALLSDLSQSPVQVLACLLFVLVLNMLRGVFRRRLAACAEAALRRGCMSIRPTLDAALYTVLLSSSVPLLIALIGWRSEASLASTEYTRAVGAGLAGTAFVLWSLEFCREVVRRNGLGIAHFGWSETPSRSIARQLFIFEFITVPLLVFVAIFDVQVDQPWQVSLGRFSLVLALLSLAVLAHRLLRYRHGPLLDVIERARKRSNLMLRRVWYFLAVGAPLALMVAAVLGYYYSALLLTTKVHSTLTSAVCLMVLLQIVTRSVLMARRRLARTRARGRLEAMRGSSSDIETASPHEGIDLDRVDTQATRVIWSGFAIALAACIWVVWSETLPALGALDRVELWPAAETAAETPAPPMPTGAVGTVPALAEPGSVSGQSGPITLRDVAVFLFILAVTFIAVQNLPGLVEIVLLQRMPLIAGERYAINMIIGYVLAIAGLVWAFNSIGIGWSRVQWLVAAVGLGLGFGLQEIFANLVSGIIILFERPIRVGDTVTVGEISGTVSKIRIRATWITAFNRQELIVPNKEFVTSRLINWTLSDQVLRVEIPIGIAYGSDTALARRLMLEVAEKNERVLKDPAPAVYFQGFGDSSLDFELRVHSPDLDSFLAIKDAMLTGIDEAFRKHGVEIPFPQRDVHVRSIRASLPVERGGDPPLG
ncbi:MAG: mechanosensitive ion channel [Candidatus Hydrogenedentes bacterium]|nr:mechanosensitive ion channel [Candidatus Hydrogenedentota bacterium]